MLEEKTHIPVVGVAPYLHIEVEDEGAPGTEAIKATVKEKMELFGSVNKAWEVHFL